MHILGMVEEIHVERDNGKGIQICGLLVLRGPEIHLLHAVEAMQQAFREMISPVDGDDHLFGAGTHGCLCQTPQYDG